MESAVLLISARGLAMEGGISHIALSRRRAVSKLLLHMRFIVYSARQLRRPYSLAASCRRAGKER